MEVRPLSHLSPTEWRRESRCFSGLGEQRLKKRMLYTVLMALLFGKGFINVVCFVSLIMIDSRRLGYASSEYFWRGRSTDNRSLIEMLQQGGVIKSRRAADVMEQIDRGLFVPDKDFAYMDSPMPIGFNATISAPHMHALCLELLENHLQPGMHALDVGSGTGYLTACFALMVEEQGYAVGVEHIPELVQQSIENVKKSKAVDLLETGHLSLHVGDGRNGWPDQAPYDAIHVGAAASEIPQALIEQLKPGGRMVIPVGDVFQDLQVVDKQIDGTVKEWSATSVRYVPLTSKSAQLGS